MIKFEDERAFPVTMHNGGGSTVTNLGMTLRDYFAAKAFLVAAEQFKRFVDDAVPEAGSFLSPEGCPHAARAAYAMADAMLAERAE